MGGGIRGHRKSAPPPPRAGTAPDSKYVAIALSTQATPLSEPAWVVPPTPSIRDAVGNNCLARKAPENGVAASRVSLINSTFCDNPAPLTAARGAIGAGQVRHGALYHVLLQAMNGERRCITRASANICCCVGQAPSVHCTAR